MPGFLVQCLSAFFPDLAYHPEPGALCLSALLQERVHPLQLSHSVLDLATDLFEKGGRAGLRAQAWHAIK
jgi:hypothetical protein